MKPSQFIKNKVWGETFQIINSSLTFLFKVICLVWPKIYMFFETRFKQRCWERGVGVGKCNGHFLLFKFLTFKEVFRGCGAFKGDKQIQFSFPRYWDVARINHPTHLPQIQLAIFKAHFDERGYDMPGWMDGHPGTALQEKACTVSPQVLDVDK